MKTLKEIFEDERCVYGLETTYLAFSGLRKVAEGKFGNINLKEIVAMKDAFYLDFDNHYGEEVNLSGSYTIAGLRGVCEDERELILKKAEHIIARINNY